MGDYCGTYLSVPRKLNHYLIVNLNKILLSSKPSKGNEGHKRQLSRTGSQATHLRPSNATIWGHLTDAAHEKYASVSRWLKNRITKQARRAQNAILLSYKDISSNCSKLHLGMCCEQLWLPTPQAGAPLLEQTPSD
jgi:hypothetical protein